MVSGNTNESFSQGVSVTMTIATKMLMMLVGVRMSVVGESIVREIIPIRSFQVALMLDPAELAKCHLGC